ncbi:MAG: hypothetical protein EOO46_01355 [Flavobacterium sp.]|nr:MAG: hypothetical protein EOO46_01355 [Flavobacterium sp.]
MNNNLTELLQKLPSSWDDVKMKDFQKILDLSISENQSIHFDEDPDSIGDIFDGAENSCKLLSVFLDIPVEELEAMPYLDLLKLASYVEWVTTLPEPANTSTIQWKDFETISFNSFISFQNWSKEPLKNLPALVAEFSNLTKEEVLEVSVPDAFFGFFLFKKKMLKSLKHSAKRLKYQIRVMKLKKLLPFKQKITSLRNAIKKFMDGNS